MQSNDNGARPNGGNGANGDKGWPRRIIQAVSFMTGVVGIAVDYGFQVMGEDHLPLVLYCMCFGVALGLDPQLWIGTLLGTLLGKRT